MVYELERVFDAMFHYLSMEQTEVQLTGCMDIEPESSRGVQC